MSTTKRRTQTARVSMMAYSIGTVSTNNGKKFHIQLTIFSLHALIDMICCNQQNVQYVITCKLNCFDTFILKFKTLNYFF